MLILCVGAGINQASLEEATTRTETDDVVERLFRVNFVLADQPAVRYGFISRIRHEALGLLQSLSQQVPYEVLRLSHLLRVQHAVRIRVVRLQHPSQPESVLCPLNNGFIRDSPYMYQISRAA